MSTLVISRSDLFPVGTSVKAVPAAGRHYGGAPSGTVAETQTVAATGKATFTALTDGVRYVLYALVGGEHRYLGVGSPAGPAYQTLRARIKAVRERVHAI